MTTRKHYGMTPRLQSQNTTGVLNMTQRNHRLSSIMRRYDENELELKQFFNHTKPTTLIFILFFFYLYSQFVVDLGLESNIDKRRLINACLIKLKCKS